MTLRAPDGRYTQNIDPHPPRPPLAHLICPGKREGHHYTEGCGNVRAIVQRQKIHVRPGKQAMVPVLVCPHCHTRLLPTRLEIERTRGATC
jgi:hypothetical protein